MTSLTIEQKRVDIYPSAKPGSPVIYLNTFSNAVNSVYKNLMALGCPDFCLPLEPGNSWIGQPVSALHLPPDTMLATILRDGDSVVPRGDTVLCEGDVAVLAAGHCGGKLQNVQLSEMEITADHSWNGKTLAALRLPQEELVVLVRRGRESLIPQGDTEIHAGDVLVMYGK